MIEVARVEMAMLEDRGISKLRVNLMKNGRIFGFIRPIRPTGERR
jgi:hypothetical protein